ncbi:MAG: hypothetical protein AB2693_27000 [Candidatus Thiodiazotropha sp.]
MSTRYKSVLDIPAVVAELADLHDEDVVVPADEASNNIVYLCKNTQHQLAKRKAWLELYRRNPTYACTSLTKKEILRRRFCVTLKFAYQRKS